MHIIQNIISEEVINALGWTVLYSFGQALLLALAMAILLSALQQKTARLRYAVAMSSLLGVLLWSVYTFWYFLQLQSVPVDQGVVIIVERTAATQAGEQAAGGIGLRQFLAYFAAHLPLIVSVWLMGVAFFMLRLIGGWFYLQHLRKRYIAPIDALWQEKLSHLAEKLHLQKTVELAESALVQAPMVIGFLKPIILMPVGTINGLSVAEVESILAHELAHIKRNDYLLNILQTIIEVLFYFNPAVWWISANIRLERENCCDDIAVQLCGNSLIYAKALMHVQEAKLTNPRLAMSLSGRKDQLLYRIRRILKQPQTKSNIMEKFTATCLLLFGILLLSMSAGSAHENESTEETTPSTEQVVILENAEINEQADNEAFVTINEEPVEAPIHISTIILDSLPKGNTHIKMTRDDGEPIELNIKDGKLTFLKIDGEVIPEEDYEKYKQVVKETLASIPPPPPAPPAPPAPIAPHFQGELPAPPAPPAPPTPIVPSAPAMPPAPPAPPAPANPQKGDGSISVRTIKEVDGKVVVRVENEVDQKAYTIAVGDEVSVISGDGHALKGNVLINGLNDYNQAVLLAEEAVEELNMISDNDLNRITAMADEGILQLTTEAEGLVASSSIIVDRMDELVLNSDILASRLEKVRGVKNKLQADFEEILLEANLIEGDEYYELVLTHKKALLNGKRLDSSVAEQLRTAYEAQAGTSLKGSTIRIDKEIEAK